MKIIIAFITGILITKHGASQLSGTIYNRLGQPVPSATVVLVQAPDSAIVKMGISGIDGKYQFDNVRPGSYLIQASSTGYKLSHTSIIKWQTTSTMTLDTIFLEKDDRELSAITVRSAKPLIRQSTYGTIVQVNGSILSKGSSALDVLERSPGISIDHRNNSINLQGKAGVLVLLNGKALRVPIAQVTELLRGISADDIERIELLDTPPAGYDAEGTAGVIHIILKKNQRRGTTGSMVLSAGYGWAPKAGSSFNIAHNTQRWAFSGSYSYLLDRTYTRMFITSSQIMPVFGGDMSVIQWDSSRATQQTHTGNVAIQFSPDSITVLEFSLSGQYSNRNLSVVNRANYTVYDDSALFFNSFLKSTNRWKNYSGSLFAERKLGRRQVISGSLDYLRFANHNPSLINSRIVDKNGEIPGSHDSLFAPLQKGFANTDITMKVIKADYSRIVNSTIKFSSGIKLTSTHSASYAGIESLINGNWVNRNETINDVVMNESIAAIYGTLDMQINKHTGISIGSRYEHVSTKMENNSMSQPPLKRNKGNLFPSFFATRKLSNEGELQFSYTQRINRPSFNDLASFVRYSDATSVYTGNPFLRPSYSRNFKLGYLKKNNSIFLLFSRDKNAIAGYQLTQSPQGNLLYVSPQNVSMIQMLNLQFNSAWALTPWWTSSASLTAGRRSFSIHYTPEAVSKVYYAFQLSGNQAFQLPKQFAIELSGWYNSPGYNGTTRVSGMGAVSFGIRKEYNKHQQRLQLSVIDIFSTLRIYSRYGTLTNEAFLIRSYVDFSTESGTTPIIRFSYSRSLGLAGKSRSRTSGDREERDRVRND